MKTHPACAMVVQRGAGDRLRVAALTIYVVGVVSALLASGLLHLVDPSTELRDTLRRVDHATIFFLIAASYTPIHIIQFKGLMHWGGLGIVWIAAANRRRPEDRLFLGHSRVGKLAAVSEPRLGGYLFRHRIVPGHGSPPTSTVDRWRPILHL